eukprot:gene9501-12799_t
MNNIFIDYVSGVAGGVSVVLVGHPFDTTKTRLQTAPPGFYSSTFDCVKKTFQWEGLGGFYSGIISPLLGQMFFRAASFTTFHYSVRSLQSLKTEQTGRNSALQLLLSGGMTGIVIAFIETPIDLLKTKLQIQIFGSRLNPSIKPKYSTVFECGKYIINTNGVKGLWQGLSATTIRNIPANALFFPVNELVKYEMADIAGVDVKNLNIKMRLFAGACAGLSYWVLTYPLDVIKARSQSVRYSERLSWIKTVQSIYKQGGIRAFGNGLLPCAMRAVPACAAMFATDDYNKSAGIAGVGGDRLVIIGFQSFDDH